jgi:hypothetical protein
MDQRKRDILVQRLSQMPEPVLISAEEFFDGNDDLGSIGCNLVDHPGIDVFRKAFSLIAKLDGVSGVYVRIAEADPGHGSWPFADTAIITGSPKKEEVVNALSELHPDEVSTAFEFGLTNSAPEVSESSLVAWWD